MHYRALRNKHQRNEFFPSFVVPPRRSRRGESVQNWARRRVCEGNISFEGASFPAEVIFSPSSRRPTNFSCRKRVREPNRDFFFAMVVRLSLIDYYFAPLSRRRESSNARHCIYVYNCTEYAFLPLKIIDHRSVIINYPSAFSSSAAKRREKSEHRTSRMQILWVYGERGGSRDFVITRERTIAPDNFLVQSADDSTEYFYTRSFCSRWVNNSLRRPVKTLSRRRFVKNMLLRNASTTRVSSAGVNLYFLIGSPRIRFVVRIIREIRCNLRADTGNNLWSDVR